MASQPPPPNVQLLAMKLYDPDSDIRFMSLTDILGLLSSPQATAVLTLDYNTCAKFADGLIHTLQDTNGEVQNLTVKALGPFVNKAHANIMCPFLGRLSNMDLSTSVDLSVRALALRSIVVTLPRPIPGAARTKEILNAYDAISKVMIPRLLGDHVFPPKEMGLPDVPKGLLQEDMDKNVDNNNLDILTEIARCFGPMLRPAEMIALQKIVLQILEDDRIAASLKKKAVASLSALADYFTDDMMSALVSHLIQCMRTDHITPANRKLYFNILASMARSVPAKFGPHLRTLTPFVLAALSQQELDEQLGNIDEEEGRDPLADEVREVALIALDSFLSYCISDMQRYLDDCSDATLRFLKYDPTLADSEYDIIVGEAVDEDDVEDDDFELEEDFEAEDAGDDDDDVSWKVRRCAARTLNTMVSVRGLDLLEDSTRFNAVMHALLGRLNEREEVVRIEVLATLGFLVRKIGEQELQSDHTMTNGADGQLSSQPASRKRRRGASDVSMTEPFKASRLTGSTSPETRSPPRIGPPANLAHLSGDIFKGLLKLLKSTSTATKLAVMSVLKDLIVARRGDFAQSLPSLIGPIIETINSGASTSSIAPTTGPSIQNQALQLTSEIAKAHSSSALLPHFPQLLAAVIKACQAKYHTISCEALSTLEQLVKVVTPPRNASATQQSAAFLEQMFTLSINLISSRTVDLSVRQHATGVLGTIVGRTFGKGEGLLSQEQRARGLQTLLEMSKNETTRFASIKAIEAVAQQSPTATRFDAQWFFQACMEMGNQLRKSDRNLRIAGLAALRALLVLHLDAGNLDPASGQQLSVATLRPMLNTDDLAILGPVLVIYTSMVRSGAVSLDKDLISSICALVRTSTAAAVLNQLCDLVTAIGEKKKGKPLMTSLLTDVGVSGSPAVVGKVVGDLLVSGGSDVGVTINDFLKELDTTKDDKRKSLALSILGEAGLRSGKAANLSPELFIEYFGKSSDVQLNAAISLGRACAGPDNLQRWVPVILSRLQQHPEENYLVLHSVKELLQYNENDRDILPYAPKLWEASVAASRSEETRTIGAECVANLALIEPRKYMPTLQSLLSDESSTVRGTAIMAFRDVFTISDASFDPDLRPIIVEVLTTMMRDSEVENRRSSLNTFNAAARNKAKLVLPQMGHLLPLVIDQTFKDPALMREIPMGPFKHIVDDGLEVRKNAYETVYFLIENAVNRLDIGVVYDRIVAGLNDDRGIQTLCNLLVNKLSVSLPDETIRRLDNIADQFSTIIAFKPKENAVRHEHEKADEAKRNVMKIAIGLVKLFPEETTTKAKWAAFLEDMKKVNYGEMLKEVDKEMKDVNRP